MSETFRCDDKETLVAYLYEELDADLRREVERHVRTCTACAREIDGLQAVRRDLASWVPPRLDRLLPVVDASPAATATVLKPSRWTRVDVLPLWAQIAAAVLVCAVGAAIANVQIRYGSDGLTVSTGWMTRPSATSAATPAAADSWRPALVALEQNLRSEMFQLKSSTGASPVSARRTDGSVDAAALMRRMEALVNESERRQREEMAIRLAQTTRDWNIQRQGDLIKITQDLGALQGRAIRAEAGQRDFVNYVNYLRRVSAQPVP